MKEIMASLQFENKCVGDPIESDEGDNAPRKSISVDIVPSRDNHSSIDNLSIDRSLSTDNVHQLITQQQGI